MQINWIKCTERMPPNDETVIMNDIGGCLLIKALNPKLPKETMDGMQWTPYTEATWKELQNAP